MLGTILAAALAFHVSWIDNSDNEEGFKVYRDAVVVATLPAGSQGYDDATVTYGTQYCYQVSAFNHNSAGDLQESMSGQACLMIDQAPEFLPPAAPTMGTVTQK